MSFPKMTRNLDNYKRWNFSIIIFLNLGLCSEHAFSRNVNNRSILPLFCLHCTSIALMITTIIMIVIVTTFTVIRMFLVPLALYDKFQQHSETLPLSLSPFNSHSFRLNTANQKKTTTKKPKKPKKPHIIQTGYNDEIKQNDNSASSMQFRKRGF